MIYETVNFGVFFESRYIYKMLLLNSGSAFYTYKIVKGTYFSRRIVRFLGLFMISSNFRMTRLSYLTSSFGLGYSLNLTVLIRDLENFWDR